MELRNIVPWRRANREVAHPQVDPLFSLQSRINSLFEDFFSPSAFGRPPGLVRWDAALPSIDLAETPEELRVEAELPGVSQADVHVELDEDVLTIRGEKRSEQKHEKDDYHHVERTYGSFRRSLRLPCDVDAAHVEATFDKGVLTVRMPKQKDAAKKVREIPVGKG